MWDMIYQISMANINWWFPLLNVDVNQVIVD